MVIISITLSEPSTESDLRSLRDWLTADINVDAVVAGKSNAANEQQQMGTGLDILQLVVSGSLDLTAVVISYLQWRKARSVGYEATIERDGHKVRLVGDDPAVLTRLIDRIVDAD